MNQLISSTLVGEISAFSVNELKFFDSSDRLEDCLDILAKYKIQSAPVWDSKSKRFIGMIDLMDFVNYVLWVFGNSKRKEGQVESTPEGVIDFSHMNPCVPILEGDTLKKAMQTFSNKSLHRAPILSQDGSTLISLLSQSAIIKWLNEHKVDLGDIGFKSIRELHVAALGTVKPVFTTTQDVPLMDAFSLIQGKQVTGIGIVDNDGILIGSLSVTDITQSVGENVELLSFPVKVLLETFERRPLITCTGSDSLNDVLEKLATMGVHRIFVIDWEGKPVGVVTCTDIIDVVLSLTNPSDSSWK